MSVERRTPLEYAIDEARAGRREQAAEVLWKIVADDPANTDAWLWLSGVVVDPAEQRAALERVLLLDPSHARAQQGLAWLQQHHPELWAGGDTPAPVQAGETGHAVGVASDEWRAHDGDAETEVLPASDRGDRPGDGAGVLTGKGAEVGALPPPDHVMNVGHSQEDEELRCPDCGEWAGVMDVQCPRCRMPLIVAAPSSLGARIARWLMVLTWLLTAAAAISGTVALIQFSQRLQSGDFFSALVLGAWMQQLGVDGLPQTISTIGLSLGIVALLSLLMAGGLAARWRPIYVLHILLAIGLLAGAIALVVFTAPILADMARTDTTTVSIVVGSLLGVPLLQTLLALLARREFFPRRERIRLPVEERPADEHFRLGSRYAQRGWRWAAARELEQAKAIEPHTLKYRRTLADVYASMGHHTRAREELRVSVNLQPDTSPVGRAGPIGEDTQREWE